MNVHVRPQFTVTDRGRLPFECVALVLQGGGALGAYQAGVYEALAEAGVHPDWVAGVSIGAINGALIAGNPPETRVDKLRAFWEGITASPHLDWTAQLLDSFAQGDTTRQILNQTVQIGPDRGCARILRFAISGAVVSAGRHAPRHQLL